MYRFDCALTVTVAICSNQRKWQIAASKLILQACPGLLLMDELMQVLICDESTRVAGALAD
jgi:hypothetical protein